MVSKQGLDFLCFVLTAHSNMCHHSGFFWYYTSQQNSECGREDEGLIPCSTSRPSPEIAGAKPAELWIRPPCLSRTGIARIRNLALSCAGMQGCRGKAWGNMASYSPLSFRSFPLHPTGMYGFAAPILRAKHGPPYFQSELGWLASQDIFLWQHPISPWIFHLR